ncbi:MAG TPA: HAD family hydrolase [bacterium]|nr:HAD family hydrolase [bacterium]
MKKNFILFDFDGVIVDSFAPAFSVTKVICPDVTEDDYRRRFEGNINSWQESNHGHSNKCQHAIDFFSKYLPRMRKEVSLMKGMAEVIVESSKNFTLVIISSTTSQGIKNFLEDHHLLHYFTEILGNDISPSKIEKMKIIFSKYGIAAKDCLFITDTLGDLKEAAEVNIKTVAVTWGFHSLKTLEKGNPWVIVNTSQELLATINNQDSFNL